MYLDVERPNDGRDGKAHGNDDRLNGTKRRKCRKEGPHKGDNRLYFVASSDPFSVPEMSRSLFETGPEITQHRSSDGKGMMMGQSSLTE